MSIPKITEHQGYVTFEILVVPKSSREKIGPVVGDRIKICVTSPPVDGKANKAVIELLAQTLDIPKKDVEIIVGTSGKRKTVRVSGIGVGDVLKILDCKT